MLAQQYFKPENVNANEGGDGAAAANDEEGAGAVNAAAVAELKLLPRLTWREQSLWVLNVMVMQFYRSYSSNNSKPCVTDSVLLHWVMAAFLLTEWAC